MRESEWLRAVRELYALGELPAIKLSSPIGDPSGAVNTATRLGFVAPVEGSRPRSIRRLTKAGELVASGRMQMVWQTRHGHPTKSRLLPTWIAPLPPPGALTPREVSSINSPEWADWN